ncbi:unnamed protein product [Acanthoscelides obtectus]|uniref:Uncharacterized protein n=1 Tax=Acanthoscelides obtectus TaxID=200917 RepID=A0A9P0MFF0_ACAOB|nr:unnamed protein product [Acanthoscelides obtectus]CAH2012293.1 unnamed protein product [Acanthoscelides obtectus]CAK1630310.1 hypothetical protein AOBTE_LOCUS6250 [Acanthoscelides obtectus]CAK1630312.1 hypothetical protein AOBTE_LOCUS6252 [Acanthoscelides obtectus]
MKEPSEHSDKEHQDKEMAETPDQPDQTVKVEPTEQMDCGSTMVSVVVHNNGNSLNHTRYNPEIELSTDTEDSASESSERVSVLSKVDELLKSVDCTIRQRVLGCIRHVTQEVSHLQHETRTKDMQISELEKQIKELKSQMANGTSESTVENSCATEEGKSSDDNVEKRENGSSVIAAVEDQKECVIRKAAQ